MSDENDLGVNESAQEKADALLREIMGDDQFERMEELIEKLKNITKEEPVEGEQSEKKVCDCAICSGKTKPLNVLNLSLTGAENTIMKGLRRMNEGISVLNLIHGGHMYRAGMDVDHSRENEARLARITASLTDDVSNAHQHLADFRRLVDLKIVPHLNVDQVEEIDKTEVDLREMFGEPVVKKDGLSVFKVHKDQLGKLKDLTDSMRDD